MANIRNENGYNGLLVHDPRITLANSDFTGLTQAGVKPGLAEPQQSGSEAVLVTSGTANEETITVSGSRSGYSPAAEWRWVSDALPAADLVPMDYVGWNAPNLRLDSTLILGATTDFAGTPGCVRTSTGRVVVAGVIATATTVRTVYVTYTDDMMDWDGSVYGIRIISENDTFDEYLPGYTIDGINSVCLVYDEEHETLKLYIRVIEPIGSTNQFLLYESTDDGETWTLRQKDCLRGTFSPSYDCNVPTIGRVAGSWVLVQPSDDTSTYHLTQWVSYDNGYSFEEVDDRDLADKPNSHRLVEWAGQLLCYLREDASGYFLCTPVSSGTSIIAEQTAVRVTGISAQPYAVTKHAERIWVISTNAANSDFRVVAASDPLHIGSGVYDGFQPIGHDAWSYGSVTLDVGKLMACPGTDESIALCYTLTGADVETDAKNLLFCARMGGWSTLTMPPTQTYFNVPGRVSFGPANVATTGYFNVDAVTWEPCVEASIAGWSIATAGTPASTFVQTFRQSPYLWANCSAGDTWTATYVGSISPDVEVGCMALIDCRHTRGGGAGDTIGFSLQLGSATHEFKVTAQFNDDDSITLTDYASSNTTTITDIVTTERRLYLLAFRVTDTIAQTGVSQLYSAAYSTYDGLWHWNVLGSRDVTGSAPMIPTMALVVKLYSMADAGGSGAGARFYSVQAVAASGYPGLSDLADEASARECMGAPVTSPVNPLYLPNGMGVSFTSGAIRKDDEYLIEPAHDYAAAQVLPDEAPSPRIGWRSTSDAADCVFTWALNTDTTLANSLGQTSWGLALLKANFQTATLDYSGDEGATWTTLLDIDRGAEFTDIPYALANTGTTTGPYVTVDTGGTGGADRFIHENELSGGIIILDGVPMRIIRNTSGLWSTDTGKKPVIFVNEDDFGAGVAETGLATIVPPDSVHMMHGLGDVFATHLRLTIPTQTTATGYFELGQLVLGPVYLFGRRYSFGRTVKLSHGTNLTTGSSGMRFASEQYAARRAVTFAWVDGIHDQNLYLGSEPSYVTIGTTDSWDQANAALEAVHSDLSGLYSRLNGPAVPVVYLAHIPSQNANPPVQTDITEKGLFMYGRIQGELNLSTVLGTEGMNEVWRIGEITIEEEL